jgi:hypothetical protein
MRPVLGPVGLRGLQAARRDAISSPRVRMRMKRSRSKLALRLGLSVGLAWSSAGCNRSGSSAEGGAAAPISPEMKKKADENLKDYAQRAAARAKARRTTQP